MVLVFLFYMHAHLLAILGTLKVCTFTDCKMNIQLQKLLKSYLALKKDQTNSTT